MHSQDLQCTSIFTHLLRVRCFFTKMHLRICLWHCSQYFKYRHALMDFIYWSSHFCYDIKLYPSSINCKRSTMHVSILTKFKAFIKRAVSKSNVFYADDVEDSQGFLLRAHDQNKLMWKIYYEGVVGGDSLGHLLLALISYLICRWKYDEFKPDHVYHLFRATYALWVSGSRHIDYEFLYLFIVYPGTKRLLGVTLLKSSHKSFVPVFV